MYNLNFLSSSLLQAAHNQDCYYINSYFDGDVVDIKEFEKVILEQSNHKIKKIVKTYIEDSGEITFCLGGGTDFILTSISHMGFEILFDSGVRFHHINDTFFYMAGIPNKILNRILPRCFLKIRLIENQLPAKILKML